MPTVAVFPFYRIGSSPLALEIMHVFNAGSSVYANVYSDAGGTVPMMNSAGAPIQADGNGLFPVVFAPVGAAYDIKFFTPLLMPRDTYLGIVPASGGGGSGTDSYQVKANSGDTTPGYLSEKMIDSTTVHWTDIDVGSGVKKMAASIDPSYVLDWKIKTDASDILPDYIGNKIESGSLVTLTLDSITHKIRADFIGPSYVPQAGGEFTGSVIVDGQFSTAGDTTLATGIGSTLYVPGAATFAHAIVTTLHLPTILSGDLLTIDGSGNVVGISAPTNDRKIIHDAADTIPGYIGTKIVAGTGITINTTTDGTNGVVMHINMNALPAISQPAQQIVVGTGTGITSFSGLKGTANSVTAGNAFLGSSTSQPSCAFYGSVGGDPGGGNTVGILTNTTNLLFFSSTSGWIKAQVGSTTVSTIDTTAANFYVPLRVDSTMQLVGVPGVGTQGTIVADAAGNVSVVESYLTSVVPFASAYSFGSSTSIFTVTSITLTAGTWEVEGQVNFNEIGSFQGQINIGTSNASILTDGYDAYTMYIASYSGTSSATVNRRRWVVASGTQVLYLLGISLLGTPGSGKAWGQISARRIF